MAAGEEDSTDASGITSTAITVTGGSYTVGQDGQGTITLDRSDVTVGVAGVQTLAVTFVDFYHARVIQSTTPQHPAEACPIPDVYGWRPDADHWWIRTEYNGVDVNPGEGLYVAGGVATADGAGNFTPMTLDENVAGNLFIGDSVAGAYSAPDANGRGTFNVGALNFVYYIVNSECLRIVDIDAAVTTAGSFYGQGSSAGTITVASVTGANVFTESGSGSLDSCPRLVSSLRTELAISVRDSVTQMKVTARRRMVGSRGLTRSTSAEMDTEVRR